MLSVYFQSHFPLQGHFFKILLFVLIISKLHVFAQCGNLPPQVLFKNPSFEDNPKADQPPVSWLKAYDGGTPDVQPAPANSSCSVSVPAKKGNGNTYLGLMYCGGYQESVSQALLSPLQKGLNYKFSVDLMGPQKYSLGGSERLTPYCAGIELWGAFGPEHTAKAELLWASPGIPTNDAWNTLAISFTPGAAYTHIIIFCVAGPGCISNGGCTYVGIDNFTSLQQLPLDISVSPVSCNGYGDGKAIVHPPAGATPPLNYKWNNGASTATIENLKPGKYSVIITDALGRTACDTIEITEPVGIIPALVKKDVTCFGDKNGNAVIEASGGSAPYTYSWNTIPVQTTNAVGNLAAGQYTCVVTDSKGCTKEQIVSITAPDKLETVVWGKNPACAGSSNGQAGIQATGGLQPYTYSWNTSPVSSTSIIGSLKGGTYVCTVTDKNGCTASAAVSIRDPEPLTEVKLQDVSVCSGSKVSIKASLTGGSGKYYYSWQPAGTGNTAEVTVSPVQTQTYTLTVADSCGMSVTGTVKATVLPLPEIDMSSDQKEGCPTLCINFTAKGSTMIGEWLWDFGDGEYSNKQLASHCYKKPGFYAVSLKVVSENGCINTISKADYIRVYDIPKADFSFTPQSPTLLEPKVQFSDLSSGAKTWSWNFGDGDSLSGLRFPDHIYKETGTYAVCLQVSNPQGCRDSVCKTLQVVPDWTFYIPNSFTPDDDGINDVFFGKGTYIRDCEMLIFDRWGNRVYYATGLEASWNGKLNNGSRGEQTVQTDVYVYKIKVKDFFNREHVYVGHVSLIR